MPQLSRKEIQDVKNYAVAQFMNRKNGYARQIIYTPSGEYSDLNLGTTALLSGVLKDEVRPALEKLTDGALSSDIPSGVLIGQSFVEYAQDMVDDAGLNAISFTAMVTLADYMNARHHSPARQKEIARTKKVLHKEMKQYVSSYDKFYDDPKITFNQKDFPTIHHLIGDPQKLSQSGYVDSMRRVLTYLGKKPDYHQGRLLPEIKGPVEQWRQVAQDPSLMMDVFINGEVPLDLIGETTAISLSQDVAQEAITSSIHIQGNSQRNIPKTNLKTKIIISVSRFLSKMTEGLLNIPFQVSSEIKPASSKK